MANSSFRRPIVNQPADPFDDRRDADPRGQASQESDPLAELARLIGQTDPLSGLGRAAPQPAAPRFEDERYQEDERYAADAPQAEEPEPQPQPPSWLQSSQNWRQQERHHEQHAAQPAQSDDFYPDEPRAYAHDERDVRDDRYADDRRYAQGTDQRYDDALYGRAPQYAEQAAQDDGPPYSYPGHEQGYDEYIPQEEPPSRRRGGLLTVAIVAMLAVLGTAGAFAYRSYTGGPKGGEPPVIRADATPTKVVPPAPSKDPSGKVITDRIGQAGERVVPREETPVEVKSASSPRVVFPPLTQQAAPSPVAPAAALAGGGGMSDEPKRIRTVSVRPDGTPAAPAPAPAASAPQAQPRPAPAAGGSSPIQITPQRTAPDPRPVAALPPAAAAPAASGGYVVQVSSQRSEADAAASYRALQAKFPSVLGSRPPLIKRADLGTKGIYYRAMIGPFASQEAASQMCGDLKTAGGQCVVQRN